MTSFCLTLSRYSLTAWVGAAILFVVTAVQEATSGRFDSPTLSDLALVRFPAYYLFGFVLVALALFFGCLARNHAAVGRRRMRICLILVALALVMMLADYFWIYTPMRDMLAVPTDARPARFVDLHQASKYVNSVQIGMCLLAAAMLNWPGTSRSNEAHGQ
jgi:hypothetical protein